MRLCPCAFLARLSLAILFTGSLAAHARLGATPNRVKPPASSYTASQLRHMTAAQFQAGIDKEGAQAFTFRLTSETDPHNWDEPNYDIILNHISSGQAAWLKIAGEIGPYATDPSFSKGLNVALAYALLENPSGVLRMRRDVKLDATPSGRGRIPVAEDDHFMHACMYPFPQPSQSFVHSYQHRALLALKRVHEPHLKAQAEDCRRELLSPPTENASR